jgi:hypothetical protein
MVLASLLAGPCLGFGTGSHFDMTHTVLAERRFKDVSIKIVQVQNWLTDYYAYSPTHGEDDRRVLAKLHFDNLFTTEQVEAYWAVLLWNLKTTTQKAARARDELAMFATLGLGLHAIQDFYSHSNWAELHPRGPDGNYRTETFWKAANLQKIASLKGLRTGVYPDDSLIGPDGEPVPRNAQAHGGHDSGLNKDSPQRPLWDEAYVFAYAASHELVGAMEKWSDEARPGFWESLRDHSVSAEDEKKLDKDITAARSISMWVKGKGQDGTWKGDGSGSQRFLSMFSSKWVTAKTSGFVDIIHDGAIQEQLIPGLYEEDSIPKIPKIDHYNLRRTAVILRVTYLAESKDGTSLRRKVAPGGGSDFYSRITAGKQEFWGRTVQKSRETVDPWYEIFIVDPAAGTLPISISVWDEDNIDADKDQHIDVNPAAGVRQLSLLLRLSDSSLTGDISGIFSSRDELFSAEGAKPDKNRAVIRGFITQLPIIALGNN